MGRAAGTAPYVVALSLVGCVNLTSTKAAGESAAPSDDTAGNSGFGGIGNGALLGAAGRPGPRGGGDDTAGTGPGPSVWWTVISAGWGDVAVGVTSTGELVCWGFRDVEPVLSDCPGGQFVAAAMGEDHGCALNAAGEVTCWGGFDYEEEAAGANVGQMDPPVGSFGSVVADASVTCGIQSNDHAACWGYEVIVDVVPLDARFSRLDVGLATACGVTTSGSLACWGYELGAAVADRPGGQWSDVTVGSSAQTDDGGGRDFACALDLDGYVTCWGGPWQLDYYAPHDVQFQSISAGYDGVCGITVDTEVECWEWDDPDWWASEMLEPSAPKGPGWASVTVEDHEACALSTDGLTIQCFPHTPYFGLWPEPALPSE